MGITKTDCRAQHSSQQQMQLKVAFVMVALRLFPIGLVCLYYIPAALSRTLYIILTYCRKMMLPSMALMVRKDRLLSDSTPLSRSLAR